LAGTRDHADQLLQQVHESHGTAVQQAQRGSQAGALMCAVGVVGIATTILLWWLTR
jgi:hypothetical protein